MIFNLILASAFILSPSDRLSQTGNEAFDFYWGEFTDHYLEQSHGMKGLIEDGLAESLFFTTSEQDFRFYIRELQLFLQQNPDRLADFRRLDRKLQREFEKRLEHAHKKRWLYSAGGAVAGALLALPAGQLLPATLGSAARLWIALPIGIVAGGGLGFLLGHLLESPAYAYSEGVLLEDLEWIEDELEDLDR